MRIQKMFLIQVSFDFVAYFARTYVCKYGVIEESLLREGHMDEKYCWRDYLPSMLLYIKHSRSD
jgi:hypothetical protein